MAEPIKPDNPAFLSCDCEEHAIAVSVFRWPDGVATSVDLDFWHMGHQVPTWRNWWQRLRDAWRVFRYGTLYLDTITLEPQKAKRLAKVILKAALDVEESQR